MASKYVFYMGFNMFKYYDMYKKLNDMLTDRCKDIQGGIRAYWGNRDKAWLDENRTSKEKCYYFQVLEYNIENKMNVIDDYNYAVSKKVPIILFLNIKYALTDKNQDELSNMLFQIFFDGSNENQKVIYWEDKADLQDKYEKELDEIINFLPECNQSHNEIIIKDFIIRKPTYESLCTKITRFLKNSLFENQYEYYAITSRVKDINCLSSKIVKYKYENLDQITDIAGIRIITYYADTVRLIAAMIENEFDIDVDNSIDVRKSFDPDRAGSISVHYVIKLKDELLKLDDYSGFKDYKIEIQIRTLLQHTWAEMDHALINNSNASIPKSIIRERSRMAGLLEIVDKEYIEIRNKLSLENTY